MLIQFSLTNYRRFRSPAVLDLSEARITEFKDSLLGDPTDGLRVLPLAALYGPNGSGKSSLLDALFHLRTLVLDAPSADRRPCFFRPDPSQASVPTEYEVVFRTGEYEYDYQLKTVPGLIREENLFGRHLSSGTYDVLFDRDAEGVFLCTDWEHADVSRLTDDLPLLYFLGQNQNDEQLSRILDFFKKIHRIGTELPGDFSLEQFLETDENVSRLLRVLSGLDLPVTGIRNTWEGPQLEHLTGREKTVFLWEEESEGIRRTVYWSALLLAALREGWLVLADNPEICLHSKVFGALIGAFTAPGGNPSRAQLLLSTQELSNMNNSLLRRDEIWLTAPAPDGSSALYPLALYLKENGEKVRKDETYYKQYLEGRYGADPKTDLTSLG